MKVVVYGLSNEGYSIAKLLALKGIDTAIVDEGKGMAISIRQEIAMSYATVNVLIDDEPLLKVEPESTAIASADYIFFTPIIKRVGQDAHSDISSKLKSISRNLKRDVSLVYCLPTIIGGSKEIIDVIKYSTNSKIKYVYMPIKPDGSVYLVGSDSAKDDMIYYVGRELNNGMDIEYIDVRSAELLYARSILSNYTPLIITFDLCRAVDDSMLNTLVDKKGISDIFIDDLASALFDMHILAYIDNHNTVHIINNCIKIIEGYTKHLVDRIKHLLKKRELRASKTRVLLAWDINTNSMRNDRSIVLSDLSNRLKDHIEEVGIYYHTSGIYRDDKVVIILTCSRRDNERVLERYNGKEDIIIIKANPLCEVVR
jgi:hypothetical protein